MQMVEPDFWKGRGRYSKQALSRKLKEETPITAPEPVTEDSEDK